MHGHYLPAPPTPTPIALVATVRFSMLADERTVRVSGGGDGAEHRGADVEAPTAGFLLCVRLPRAVHVHALRVSVLQLEVLRAAQGDPLPKVRVVTSVNML